jgi:hypothetical protein
MFLLKYHAGFSLFETYNLPIPLRKWFVEKLVEQKEKEAEQMEKASKKQR